MLVVIAVDIGTTHIKAVVLNRTGTVLSEAKQSYATNSPHSGYSEQEPASVFEAVFNAIQTVVQLSGNVSFAGVVFSAAMHSMLAVNIEGRPLTPAITWADTRSNEYALLWKQTGIDKTLCPLTGVPMHPMLPLCKIAWVKEYLPNVFQQAAKFISLKEYILFRLTNEYKVDTAMASAMGLLNIHTGQWCTEALKLINIETHQLSEVVDGTYLYKGRHKDFETSTGIPASVPIIIGATDGCLAAIGSGALQKGEVALTIGTSGAARRLITQPLVRNSALYCYRIEPDLYLSGGAINNGGAVVQWFAKSFLQEDGLEHEMINKVLTLAETAPAGCDGLLFLPYVFGERSPFWDAEAKGMFANITGVHRLPHFARAVLEGIAFAMKQVIVQLEENEPVSITYASGGFTASAFWRQLLSNVLQKPLYIDQTADASAKGAAFMAMRTLGWIKEWSEIKTMLLSNPTVVQPIIKDGETYHKAFEKYEALAMKNKKPDASL